MNFKKGIFVFAAAGMIFLHGQAAAQENDIVAKIRDKKITITEFNKIIDQMGGGNQKMSAQPPQQKEVLLRRLMQIMAVSDLAGGQGFDQREDIKEQMKIVMDNFIAVAYLKSEVDEKIKVTEEDMKHYYKIHQDDFKAPEMLKARHILVKADKSASEEDRKKAREKAEEALRKAKAGEDFAKLASDFSDDLGSKTKGGDLGLFPRGKMVKAFEDAAFALKPGELSGIVETGFGYHIIKAEEKTPGGVQTFEKVRETVNKKVFEERRQARATEIIEKAVKDAGVEMYPEKLTPKDKPKEK